MKRTSPEVKCLHLTSSKREMCKSSVSKVIYHKFSHGAAFYTLNGKNVNVMLEFWVTLLHMDLKKRFLILGVLKLMPLGYISHPVLHIGQCLSFSQNDANLSLRLFFIYHFYCFVLFYFTFLFIGVQTSKEQELNAMWLFQT